jgi:hypothetical protein
VSVSVKIMPPIEFKPARSIREQIIELLTANPAGLTKQTLEAEVVGSTSGIHNTIEALAAEGVVVLGVAKAPSGRTVKACRLKT